VPVRRRSKAGPFKVRWCERQPNKRLKLAAPVFKGNVMFVNNQTARRSLSAIR